jgi:hypothetical protein
MIKMKNETRENWNRRDFTALKLCTEITAQTKVPDVISHFTSEKIFQHFSFFLEKKLGEELGQSPLLCINIFSQDSN